MHTFLEEVSRYILDKYSDQTGDLCIVTPNRRAGLFFRKRFSAAVSRPMWAPDILSIEDFINKITGLNISDSTGLLFEFYRVYQNIEKEQAEDIDRFSSWASNLMRDFDDIDNALADRGKLYAYLTDIRYIDTWNPDGKPLTLFQENYLGFIGKLGGYHEALAKHLLQKGMAWQGLSSRKAAELLDSGEYKIPWKRLVFAGFNALTAAEERIIESLQRDGKADYLIDSDPYYTNDPEHEAGRFIRKYSKKFKVVSRAEEKSFFSADGKRIHVIGISKNVHQARLAGNLLEYESFMTVDEQTAVVLANESLLNPMLNALPSKVTDINVTMGFPLGKTNMYQFFDSLFHLFLHGTSTDREEQIVFYYRDLHRLFSNSLAALLWDIHDGKHLVHDLLFTLAASNKSFCSYEALCEMASTKSGFESAFGFLHTKWDQNIPALIAMTLDLAEKLDVKLREKAANKGSDILHTSYFVDFESLYYFSSIFRRLEQLLDEFPVLDSLKTLYRLFKQLAAEAKLSFSGEPLQGLQVMGMLETRSLDFTNVILLSANEQILPKPKSVQSFIPFEVRRAFSLRLYQEQDAIFAYHFYRLLQRAKNVFIIYNTQAEDIGSSEKSRFVSQLQVELPRFNPNIKITEEIIALPPQTGRTDQPIVVEKTEEGMERLYTMAEKGLSPSALSRYINCPLQFYLEKVMSLQESEEVEETLEAATIGSVAHDVLEKLYRPFLGKLLSADDVGTFFPLVNDTLQQSFARLYSGGRIDSGKNLLLYHLTKRYLENMLKAERRQLELDAVDGNVVTLLALEEPLRAPLRVDDGTETGRVVNLRGLADRIDRSGSIVRVIDYKTGKIKQGELSFNDWDILFDDSDKAKNFQLLCYAWMYNALNPAYGKIEPGIISLRTPGKWLQTIKDPDKSGVFETEKLKTFEAGLRGVVQEILQRKIPFRQTENVDNCQYCPFKALCNRY